MIEPNPRVLTKTREQTTYASRFRYTPEELDLVFRLARAELPARYIGAALRPPATTNAIRRLLDWHGIEHKLSAPGRPSGDELARIKRVLAKHLPEV